MSRRRIRPTVVLDVTWRLDGADVANPATAATSTWACSRRPPATHTLSANRQRPGRRLRDAHLDGRQHRSRPRRRRSRSRYVAHDSAAAEHNVYFERVRHAARPADDQPGFVVGELRLERRRLVQLLRLPRRQPFGTPFTFTHTGKVVKSLTYGNLGTGGLSKAAFEQYRARLRPGYDTHTDRAPGHRRLRQHRHARPVPGDRASGCVAGVYDDHHGKRKTG